MAQIIDINIDALNEHPLNREIYGIEKELPADFIKSIENNGILVPIVVNQNRTIIIGHRRWRGSKQCGLTTVPTLEIIFADELSETEALIHSNYQRERTFSQKMREGKVLERIEKEKARLRQVTSTGGANPQLMPTLAQAEKGTTSAKVAKQLGMGKTTYAKGKVIMASNDKELIDKIDRKEKSINHGFISKLGRVPKEKKTHPFISTIGGKQKEKKGVNIPQYIDLPNNAFGTALPDVSNDKLNMIMTQPPFSTLNIDFLSNLGEFAAKKLKQDGYLIAYVEEKMLAEAIIRFSENLNYRSTFSVYQQGPDARTNEVNLLSRCMHILVFQKSSDKKLANIPGGCIGCGLGNEDEGKQIFLTAKKLIEMFSKDRDTICDPFPGTGQIAEACRESKRNFLEEEDTDVIIDLSTSKFKLQQD